MSVSNDEEVLEVSEDFKDLFKDSHFKFEGLSVQTEEDFVKVVKGMGAKASNEALITFVQSSYFEKQRISGRTDYYNINYVADSVEAGKALDLKNYIFVPDVELDDEPICYAARYMYRTESCHKCYYSTVFCDECAKESIKESLRAANQDRKHVISETDKSLKDEIMNSSDQEVLGHSSKASKRMTSLVSEKYSDDEEQRKANCTERSRVRKRLKMSSDVDDTSNREESPEIYVLNSSDSDCSQSNDKAVNNSQNGQVEEAKNGISGTESNVIEQRTLKPSTNGVAETADNISLSDDPNDGNSDTRNKKKSVQKKKTVSVLDYVMSSKSKMPLKIKSPALVPEPEPLPHSLNIAVDEDKYFTGEEWWKPRNIPVNERCTIPFCSFEPTSHPSHYRPKKFLSQVEKKILVKYLIIRNAIHNAKGQNVYKSMIEEGYLSHRTYDTLRNCFRRTILQEVDDYKLGNILQRFSNLRSQSNTRGK